MEKMMNHSLKSVRRTWTCASWSIFLIVLCFVGTVFAGPVTAWHHEPDRFGHAKWEQLGAKKGIKLARKQLPASRLFAVRGEMVMPASIDKVASVIYDETRWAEWSDTTSQAMQLSSGPGNMKTVYQAVNMPFILSDRDVIYTFGYEYVGDRLMIIGRTLPYRNSPKTIGVRMHLLEGRWFLKPVGENKTHLVLEILMDPKGSLPSWFVNLVQKDYPVSLLTSLARQAQRPDVRPLHLPSPAISDGVHKRQKELLVR